MFGASAIADPRDVIPSAIEAVGGTVEHFGMPVDPGNLMLVGEPNGHPVLGAPGCARSPKENGFDWILARLLAGLPVTRADITGIGVGGLLMEIVTRPQPRDGAAAGRAADRRDRAGRRPLDPHGRTEQAAGRDRRQSRWCGSPPSRRWRRARSPVIVVTGHQRERVERALAGLKVTLVHNPDYADGLSTSLKTGIAALPADADGAVVCLGDMPQVEAGLIDRLIAAFDPARGALIVVPTIDGKRGNPVLWSRRFFPELGGRGRHRRPPPDRRLRRGRRRGRGRDGGAGRRRHPRGAHGRSRRDDRLVPFNFSSVPLAGVLADGICFMRITRFAACLAAVAIVLFAAPAQVAGALATGKCGAFGYSSNDVSPEAASQRAQAQCKGRECKVVTSFRKTCAAFRQWHRDFLRAASPWAQAATLAHAQNVASEQCNRHGGKTCVIRAWVCDSRG